MRKCWCLGGIDKNVIIESRDAVFYENTFTFKQHLSIAPLDSVGPSTSSNKFDIEMDLDADHESETEIIRRRSKRARKDPS